jgi:ribosomal protein S27E
MSDHERRKRKGDAIEVYCPRCEHTEIIYVPEEDIPKCPKCRKQMVFKEILKEGKSY